MLLFALLLACAPSSDPTDTADTGTPPVPYCDTLSEAELGLFDVVSVAGSSNSYDVWTNTGWPPPALGPYGPGDYATFYPGIVVQQAWSMLQPCGAAEPELWVRWYSDVEEQPATTTFFLALDAFYHMLDDDNADLETFRGRVQDYLVAQQALNPAAPFVVGNIPTPMMYNETDRTQEEKEAYNTCIEEEVTVYPDYYVVDLNDWMVHLIYGEVEIDGSDVYPGDILKDGLHLNEIGQGIMTQIALNRINEIWPALALPPVIDLSLEGE